MVGEPRDDDLTVAIRLAIELKLDFLANLLQQCALRIGRPLAQYGFALSRQLGCSGCHDARSTVHAPLLQGVAGRIVHLQDGRVVAADDDYLRDAILRPSRDVVAGFEPVMPSYAGQVSEQDLDALIAWLHSLRSEDARP